jgi:hypothetical protein
MVERDAHRSAFEHPNGATESPGPARIRGLFCSV